jgi:amidophosphoribosyltransferase
VSEQPDVIPDRDGPRDECGVFGIYAPGRDVARLTYFGLYALQHRGQESAGIATCEGGHITTMKDLGLVSQVFDEEKLQALAGDMAIGHVRYSTTGGGSYASRESPFAVPRTRRSSQRCSRATHAKAVSGSKTQLRT